MLSSLGFATAGAEDLFGFKVRLVGAEVASAGPQPCEESRLAAREREVEAIESGAGRRSDDSAKLMRDTDSERWRLGEHDELTSLQYEYNIFHPVDHSKVLPDAKIG